MNTFKFLKNASNALKQDVNMIGKKLTIFQRLRHIQKETVIYRKASCENFFKNEKSIEQNDKTKQDMKSNLIITNSDPIFNSYDKYILLSLIILFGGYQGLKEAHERKKSQLDRNEIFSKEKLDKYQINEIRETFVCGFLHGSLYAIPVWMTWCHPIGFGLIGGSLIVYKCIPTIV